MNTSNHTIWRKIQLAATAVALGLMIASSGFAQKGRGGGGGARGGGSQMKGVGGQMKGIGGSSFRGSGNVMRGNSFSSGGMQRSASPSFRQQSSGMNSMRGGVSPGNVLQQNFSGSRSAVRGSAAFSGRSSSGFNGGGVRQGSSTFVQRNFGNTTDKIGGNAAGRSSGTSNLTQSPRGNSGFVSRNFADVTRGNGDRVARQGSEISGRQRAAGATRSSVNDLANGRRTTTGNSNNDWNGDGDHHGWDDDWDDHDHGWPHYQKPFYGYGNYGYYHYPDYYWYWPLIGLAWGLAFGHGPYYGYADYGYGGYYDYGYSPSPTYYAAPATESTVVVNDVSAAAAAPNPGSADPSFVGQGEAAFKEGRYADAVRLFRHALVDDPNNGAYLMILGQALFAVGEYNEAAGATQKAAQLLPQDKWGTIVANYGELYTNVGDYTTQLRALEKARDAKPNDPALHFLLGWHYGYLGHPKEAVRELNKTLELMPTDQVAKVVRDAMNAKLRPAEEPAPEPVEPPAPADVR